MRATTRLMLKLGLAKRPGAPISLVAHSGSPMWSEILRAHSSLWEPGSNPVAWTLVVTAPTLAPEAAYQRLPEILERLKEFAETEPQDDADREFQEELIDCTNTHNTLTVPDGISPDFPCILFSCLLERKGLPGGILKRAPLPVVLSECGSFAVGLHKKYWDPGFLKEWERGFDEPFASEQAVNYTALEAKGLPVLKLNRLETDIQGKCEAAGVSCHFINVGTFGLLRDPVTAEEIQAVQEGAGFIGKLPCDDHFNSGDLAFLGSVGQHNEIVEIIQQSLQELLSAEEISGVTLDTMDMDDFVSSYGWIMEKLHSK
jgi:hypothetical protein